MKLTMQNRAGVVTGGPGGIESSVSLGFSVPGAPTAVLARTVLTQVREARAAIIPVASCVAILALRSRVTQAASTAAISKLSKRRGADCRPDAIRADAVAPGVTKTRINVTLGDSTKRTDGDLSRLPLSWIAAPEDMIGPFLYPASPSSSHVTGAVPSVDSDCTARGLTTH